MPPKLPRVDPLHRRFLRRHAQVLAHVADLLPDGRPDARWAGAQRLIHQEMCRAFLATQGWEGPPLDGLLGTASGRARRLIRAQLLDPFQLCLAEGETSGPEAAIGPEVLGRTVEEQAAGRRSRGSYSNPRHVVACMCRQALCHHLRSCLPREPGIETLVQERNAAGLRDPQAVQEALRRIRVCDPACGSGSLLVGMLRELDALGECLEAACSLTGRGRYARRLGIVRSNLYGVDLDTSAVGVARMRLALAVAAAWGGPEHPPLPSLDHRVLAGDGLLAPSPTAASLPGGPAEGLDWAAAFPETFAGERPGFDVVVANPPFLSVKHGFGRQHAPLLRSLYATARGQFDASALFMERAFHLLREGGVYAYLVPRTLLANGSMAPVRRLLEEHDLRALADPGLAFRAFVEPVIVIGVNAEPAWRAVRVYQGLGDGRGPQVRDVRREDLVTGAGTWNPLPTAAGQPNMARLARFGDLFTLTRGEECGKRDPAIVPIAEEGAVPLLRGEDVSCCRVCFAGRWIRPAGRQLKPAALYGAPKLLVRRVSDRLVAAVDTEGYHVLNTLYAARPRAGCPMSLEFACGLLNSRAANDWFRRTFLNDDRLFPYIRKEQLAAVPMAAPAPDEDEAISALVRRLAQAGLPDGERARILARLDELAVAIYQREGMNG